MSPPDLAVVALADVARTFRNYKKLGEAAIAQVPTDADLYRVIDPDSNSIAVIVKHVAGNLRSRFHEFLTTDGEKPDRDRDSEFEMPAPPSRADVIGWWDAGWTTTLQSLDRLTPADLGRTIYIRGEAFLVLEALHRSMSHTTYHVGQIVYLARHLAGPRWRSLSIPKGRSAEFTKGDVKGTGLTRS
jgi:hypothetical protein